MAALFSKRRPFTLDKGKRQMNAKCVLALTLLFGAVSVASAQEYRGMYMGAALGTFDYEEDFDGEDAISDSTSVYQLFGGYRFNEYVALELGYGQTGDIEDDVEAFLPGLGTVTLEFDAQYDIYALRAFGILPLNAISLFASAGYFSASLGGPVSISGFGDIAELDGSESGATVSIGIQKDFRLDLENLSIRAEYQVFDIDDVDASALAIGVLFRF